MSLVNNSQQTASSLVIFLTYCQPLLKAICLIMTWKELQWLLVVLIHREVILEGNFSKLILSPMDILSRLIKTLIISVMFYYFSSLLKKLCTFLFLSSLSNSTIETLDFWRLVVHCFISMIQKLKRSMISVVGLMFLLHVCSIIILLQIWYNS